MVYRDRRDIYFVFCLFNWQEPNALYQASVLEVCYKIEVPLNDQIKVEEVSNPN